MNPGDRVSPLGIETKYIFECKKYRTWSCIRGGCGIHFSGRSDHPCASDSIWGTNFLPAENSEAAESVNPVLRFLSEDIQPKCPPCPEYSQPESGSPDLPVL